MRKFPRRSFLQLAAATAAAAPFLPSLASALDYPARPVRWINGFAPGGSPDVIARLFGQWLSARLGRNFVIENRPGAGTNIATETVARAPADGYTLLLIASPNMINASLYAHLNFDFVRDIAPVAAIGRNPFVMVTNEAFPAKTVAEFISYAKANPGKINMTSTGTGNLTNFAGELFKMMAGVDMVSVPASSEMQAQSDLLTGRVQVMFDPIVSSLGYITSGQFRALGVTGATRLATLPDVPAVGETVPGYAVDGWLGVGAPTGTPAAIVETLNAAIGAGIADPDIKARLVNLGFVPTAMTAAQFGAFVADETAKWAKVVKFAGVRLD
jgi:tripartite-type tricarboxylate transporter receptor subunit TctC